MVQEQINIGTSPNDGTGDTLRQGGEKINNNFTELYTLADNKVKYKYAYVDFEDSTNWQQQIADYLNNNQLYGGLEKQGNELIYIYTNKYISGNPTDPNNVISVVRYEWRFNRGKGIYGYGTQNDLIPGDFNLVSVYQENPNNTIVYDLGTQTSTTVEDVVNASGPYVIPSGSVVKFKINLDGQDQVYVYVGDVDISIGNGATTVDSSNFILTGNITPAPVDPSDYVTQQELSDSLFDKYEVVTLNTIAEQITTTEDFILVEVEEPQPTTYYFGVKTGNTNNFNYSRINTSAFSENYFELSEPEQTKDGYDLYLISASGTFSFSQGLNAFNVWRLGRFITIDDEKFEWKKGYTGSTKNSGSSIEENDLAIGGIFEMDGFKYYGILKCIDDTGDLTTGIETKWKPLAGVTRI